MYNDYFVKFNLFVIKKLTTCSSQV